jgi:hypothetical protein
MAISNVQGTLTVDETIINGTVSINGTIINGAVYINGQGEQGLQGIQGVQGIQGIQGESGTFDGIPLSGTTALNPITGKLEYSSNLSANFTDRSLVDKGYADTKQKKLELSIKDGYEFFTDFEGSFALNTYVGNLRIQNSGGGGSISQDTSNIGRDLIRLINTTTSTSIISVFSGKSIIKDLTYIFETTHYPANLSNGVDNFVLIAGLTDNNPLSTNANAGIFFIYDKFANSNIGVASDNYLCVCKNGASITVVDSGIPFAINTLRKLRIEKNNTDTEVRFLIDNVLKATITTNITISDTIVKLISEKKLGTSTINNYFDYLYYKATDKNRI